MDGIHLRKTFRKSILLSIALFFCFVTPAYALDVTLQWDANTEPDLAGYWIYYDTDSGHPYTGSGAQQGNSPIQMTLAQDQNPDPNVVEYTVYNLPTGTYYFSVTAYNTGNLESGYSNEVNTNSSPDSTPPIISNIQVASVTDTTAVITWTTNEASDSQVQYGTSSGNYPSNANSTGMVTSHAINLTGLSQNTTYYYRVRSRDVATNTTTSNEMNFTTNLTPDTTAPSIVGYPSINYVNDTIDVTYSESGMQNVTTEANYTFSPSLLFDTLGGSDDITNVGSNTYRLFMRPIPNNTIFTITASNITDAAGNPLTSNSVRINDNDNDGMADDWETTHGVSSWNGDADADGLTNLEEYTHNTNPNNSDTDGDTLPDFWEIAYGLDPNDSTGSNGRDGDPDNDGWTNYEEYASGYNPSSGSSPVPTPPEIRKSIPRDNSGITNRKRVPTNSSFAVRLEDNEGIDITDTSSISFTINDGAHPTYVRDLSHTSVFRVVKISNNTNDRVTKLWAVYDRSLDTYGNFAYDSNVNIRVDARDRKGTAMAQASFSFNVESTSEFLSAQNNEPYTSTLSNSPSVGLTTKTIDSGNLAGTTITYDSSEPIEPTFGPEGEVPTMNVAGVNGVYYPLNLQPPNVFNNPVRITIPVPNYENLSELVIGYYDGEDWVVACDGNGNVLPGGEGWIVPGSRVDHVNGSSSYIEIQVYHFSGAQAAFAPDGLSGISDVEEGATGGCFIATADENHMGAWTCLAFLLMFALATAGSVVAMRIRRRRLS